MRNFNDFGEQKKSFIFRHFDTIFGIMFFVVVVYIIGTFAFQANIAIKAYNEVDTQCSGKAFAECLGEQAGKFQKGMEKARESK